MAAQHFGPDLAAYLAEARARPWAWGRDDCTTFAADWVRLVTGRDVMADWRGLYSTETEAAAIIRHGGGLARLWARALTESTILPLVGVVRLGGVETSALALGGGFWAVRTPRGVARLKTSARGFGCRLSP